MSRLDMLDSEKSPGVRRAFIRKFEPKHQIILNYDMDGKDYAFICQAVSLSKQRLIQIVNSPLYKQRKEEAMAELQRIFLERKARQMAKDPVHKVFKDNALAAANKKVQLMMEAESEVVQNSASSEVLDRAGYSVQQKSITKTIEVTEKMADRFDRVLGHEKKLTISTTEEETDE